jgi:hypothetical protein
MLRMGKGTRALWVALLLFGVALLVYGRTLAPGPLGGDAGEFQIAARVWGLSHPTGYPLYMLLLKLWALLPFGSVAFRANLLAAMLAASTVACLYAVLEMVTRSVFASVLGAMTLAFSPLFWSQAVIADKYALNAFLISGVLASAAYWSQEPGRRRLCLLALVYGLSLSHHRTMLLFAPGLAGFVWLVQPSAWKTRRNWPALACLVLPLGLYATLPLTRALGQPLTNWWPSTPGEWLQYLLARGHLGEVETAVAPLSDRLALYGRTLVDQVTLWGLTLAVLGVVYLFERQRPLLFLTVVSFLLQALSSMAYYLESRNQAFYLPSFLIVVVWIGAGGAGVLQWLSDRLDQRQGAKRVIVTAAGVCLWLLPLFSLVRGWPKMAARFDEDYPLDIWRQDLISGEQATRLARAGLTGVAADAVIVGDWEQMTPFRYFQLVEGLRPDVETVYPVGRLAEAAASGRPLYAARSLPGLAERWYPSGEGPLIALQRDTTGELPAGISTLGVDLGGVLELAGYAYGEAGFHPATVVPLTLYWRALQAPLDDYSVSLRLFGDAGTEVFKVDSQHPVLGTYPTSLWTPGQVVADYYEMRLPTDLSPGTYQWGVIVYRALPDGGWENLEVTGTDSEVATGATFNVEARP